MQAAPARYASKIIKAGALLADTRLLLEHWDETVSPQENSERLRRENVFGKASRSRVEDILIIFKQRYVADPEVLAALLALVREGLPNDALNRVLYFLSLQADPLLHDVVVDVLAPRAARGQPDVRVQEVQAWVREQVAAGKTERPWGAETTERVAQGVMATLRDFGILQGAVNKRLATVYLPVRAFAFIACWLYRRQPSGDRVLHSPEWQTFFLALPAVERLFLEAHQERLLSYYAAGRVVRLEFPVPTIQEYARVLTERAD
jgi:hypothetical protein